MMEVYSEQLQMIEDKKRIVQAVWTSYKSSVC